MSFEPVDIFVKDPLGDPVEDVLVHVYDQAGGTFFDRATTDADGKASFLLETLSYSMRFNKFQVGFSQPQLFTVLASPSINVFDVKAEPFVLPISSDSRLCRCSGFFRDLDGSPKRDLDVHFIAQFSPVLLDDAAVISGERHLRTDKNGYAQIDLIRGAVYTARIQDQPGIAPRCVRVPDQASANLPNMLLPFVGRVTFDPEGPYSVAAGSEIEVTPTVYDSAGVVLVGTALADLRWFTGNSTIAVVLPTETKLVLRGLAAGSTELLAERLNKSIIKIPDAPIEGQPVGVTVT